MRLVGRPLDVYQYLEPLYNDYRKVGRRYDGRYKGGGGIGAEAHRRLRPGGPPTPLQRTQQALCPAAAAAGAARHLSTSACCLHMSVCVQVRIRNFQGRQELGHVDEVRAAAAAPSPALVPCRRATAGAAACPLSSSRISFGPLAAHPCARAPPVRPLATPAAADPRPSLPPSLAPALPPAPFPTPPAPVCCIEAI